MDPKLSNGMNTPNRLTAVVYSFFANLDYAVFFSDLKRALIFVTIIFGFLFIIVLYKLRTLIKDRVTEIKMEISPPPEAVTAYDRRWEEIKKHVASFTEAEWKMAVIEADKFLDDVLKTAGYAGESMGERLMLIEPGQLLSLQDIWDAHKLRNLLVHDAGYQLTHRQAVLAVEGFEKALRELSALT